MVWPIHSENYQIFFCLLFVIKTEIHALALYHEPCEHSRLFDCAQQSTHNSQHSQQVNPLPILNTKSQ